MKRKEKVEKKENEKKKKKSKKTKILESFNASFFGDLEKICQVFGPIMMGLSDPSLSDHPQYQKHVELSQIMLSFMIRHHQHLFYPEKEVKFDTKDPIHYQLLQATPESLIDLIMEPFFLEKNLSDICLLTHSYFTTPLILLKTLLEPFQDKTKPSKPTSSLISDDITLDDEKQCEKLERTKRQRKQSFKLLKKWFSVSGKHLFDLNIIKKRHGQVKYDQACEFVQVFTDFFKSNEDAQQDPIFAKLLNLAAGKTRVKPSIWDVEPSPNGDDWDRLEILIETDASIVAQQLTLLEFERFRSIPLEEFLKKNFSKTETAPCFSTTADSWNRWTMTVIGHILKRKDSKNPAKRAQTIQQYLKIAEFCVKFNNFHSAFAIFTALSNTAISRLEKTWEKIPKKISQIMQTMEKLFDFSYNYKNYRATLEEIAPTIPCVPYIGFYSKDLTSLDELPDTIDVVPIKVKPAIDQDSSSSFSSSTDKSSTGSTVSTMSTNAQQEPLKMVNLHKMREVWKTVGGKISNYQQRKYGSAFLQMQYDHDAVEIQVKTPDFHSAKKVSDILRTGLPTILSETDIFGLSEMYEPKKTAQKTLPLKNSHSNPEETSVRPKSISLPRNMDLVKSESEGSSTSHGDVIERETRSFFTPSRLSQTLNPKKLAVMRKKVNFDLTATEMEPPSVPVAKQPQQPPSAIDSTAVAEEKTDSKTEDDDFDDSFEVVTSRLPAISRVPQQLFQGQSSEDLSMSFESPVKVETSSLEENMPASDPELGSGSSQKKERGLLGERLRSASMSVADRKKSENLSSKEKAQLIKDLFGSHYANLGTLRQGQLQTLSNLHNGKSSRPFVVPRRKVEDMFVSLKDGKQENGDSTTTTTTTSTIAEKDSVAPSSIGKVSAPITAPPKPKPKVVRKRTAVNLQTTIAEISLTEEDTEEELSSSVVIDPSIQQEDSPIAELKTLEDSD